MDAFADLVRGVRANGALFGQSIQSPPWSINFTHAAELTLCTLLSGAGWIVPAEGPAVRIRVGDIAVVRGPEPFVIADEPDRAPAVTVHGADLCTSTSTGGNLVEDVRLGPRTWGEDPAGGTNLVIGAYQAPGDVCQRLLGVLPPVLVVPGDTGPCVELELVAAEVTGDQPGQQVVLDRLLDLLLVCTLRAWFARPEADPPAWYRALGDPVVGAVLRAMHDEPARPWTVDGLARRAGVSRAALARRFTELVGEPPLTYLTGWRMTLAADLLRRGDGTVASVASRVGYADGFAFSAAFKRVRGLSPTAYRAEKAG
ncbi:AraC family transcriptional regulator [Amycolatopsis anabasis]|uniref:AraC family transcriptional regulator n=1 Tax=Amycolatopsis anabasis TaxID=1840409 RepID=UPI00131C9843|nr:AraC family transcriptional regulator [Amycolatopsis anabasis]